MVPTFMSDGMIFKIAIYATLNLHLLPDFDAQIKSIVKIPNIIHTTECNFPCYYQLQTWEF
jgi:hypothetical protein